MKQKTLIIISVIIVLLGLLFLIWTAKKAREHSDKILNDFQRVDQSLIKTRDSLQKVKDSIQP